MTNESPFAVFNQILNTTELPALDAQVRTDRDSLESLQNKLEKAFAGTEVSPARNDLIRSLVFLWHDYLDQAHSIAQEVHTAEGSYVHGMMHRREPDYWNAKYWFNRVGQHPAFGLIGSRVATFLAQGTAPDVAAVVVRNGQWNAAGLVDLCESAAREKNANRTQLLQRIQEIEFRCLLQLFCRE